MFVKVNTSLAGADFSFRFGEDVEKELFASLVGNGWESLCDPIPERAEKPVSPDASVDAPATEVAVAVEAQERRGRRK